MRQRGFVLTLITSCMFGLGAVLAKIVGEAFNPFFVSWLALSCGGLCVSGAQLLRRKSLLPRMTRASWIDLLLFSSIGTVLPLVCIVIGLSQTSAITGSFLLQIQGPAALLFAMLFLKEKMVWKQAGGMVLLLIGSLLVILRSLDGPLQIVGGQGDLLVAIAALVLGFSYIPGKRLTERGDALQVIILRLFCGSFLLLPLLAIQMLAVQTGILTAPLTDGVIVALSIYIVSNFGLAYILQQASLGLLQAWETAALMQTLPLFSTIFAVIILHETMTPLQIIGGCIVLLGGLLVV